MKRIFITTIGALLLSNALWAEDTNRTLERKHENVTKIEKKIKQLKRRVKALEAKTPAVVDYMSVYYTVGRTYTYQDATDNNQFCDRMDRILTSPIDGSLVLRERIYTATDGTNCRVEEFAMEIQGENLVTSKVTGYDNATGTIPTFTLDFAPGRAKALVSAVGTSVVKNSVITFDSLNNFTFNLYASYETGFVEGPINETAMGRQYTDCFVYRRLESLGTETNAFYATHCPGIGIIEFVSPVAKDEPGDMDLGKLFRLIEVN